LTPYMCCGQFWRHWQNVWLSAKWWCELNFRHITRYTKAATKLKGGERWEDETKYEERQWSCQSQHNDEVWWHCFTTSVREN
jgi:hypothetical protein